MASISLDHVFQFVNLAVGPFWLLMIFLPFWKITNRVMASLWSVAWLLGLYVVLVAPHALDFLNLFADPQRPPELDRLRVLLGTREGTCLAWIHMAAFDLFVGRWIYLTSREQQMTWWLVSPILALTMMFGPAGLLAFFGLKSTISAPSS